MTTAPTAAPTAPAPLAGILDAVLGDPGVAEVVRRARLTGTASATEHLEITAPQALYPLVVGAVGAPQGAARPVLVVTATALLANTPKPTEAEVRQALAGNICRCGSHARVIRAVMAASGQWG